MAEIGTGDEIRKFAAFDIGLLSCGRGRRFANDGIRPSGRVPRTEPVEAKTEYDSKNRNPCPDPPAVMPGDRLRAGSRLVQRRAAENSRNTLANRLEAAE